jgi:hypothetical protein
MGGKVMRREGKESAERKLAKGARILQHRPPETEEVNMEESGGGS